MPPGKEKKKKDSGKQLLSPHFVMPVFPRRNYHLRTYSGANLSKNTNSGALDKDVFNIAQLLMWENRGNVAEFSELAKLDRNLDTKIMDLITAQHSLNAAEVADTNRKIAARVAELESNMSYVDKKKRELKEKYNRVMLNVSQGVKEILVGAGQQIWTTRNEFLYEWNAALDHITFDESILSVDKIGRLDLVGFDKTKKRLEGNIQRLRYLIVKLKTDLTFIKENGSDRFNTITQTATLRLKRASVSFIKDPILRALIAKYSEKKNWFYKELKYWTEKLTTLWIIMRRKAWTTIFKAESSWSEKRYFCVYPQFEEAVRSCILVNTDEIYRRYQQKFDSFTSYSTEKIIGALRWDPKTGLQKNLKLWKTEHEINSANQYLAIEQLAMDLKNLENNMNQKLDLVIRHWLPLFAECNPGSTAVVKEFADKARKNDKIDAGMSAYPFLLMKSARNSYIHKSVIEYVKCVSYTNSIFHQIQILEAESESANEHFQICDEYKTLLQSLDDELDAEIKALRIATKRTTIEKRMAKAKTIVEKIQLCHSERHVKTIEHLQSFMVKAEMQFEQYQERLKKLFQAQWPNSSEKLGFNLQELRFYTSKVEEWHADQKIIIEAMKLKLLPQTPSQTDVAVSDLGVRSPLETVKEPPFDGLLLDGRKISEVRDIVAKMENLFEVIVPSDIHFQEYDNDMIIDLPAFNFELLTPELLNLYDVVMADSQFIWEECLKEIKFKIGSKTETLALEKIKGVADSENALVRLHQLVDARIVQLASLQATHENEAAFLLDAIDLMQTNFKGKINNVIDEIHDYAEFTIPDTNSRLSKCRTMYQLHNLRKQFEILIERFNFDVEEAMNEASVDFDKTKKNIALSMQKGHHSSAWQLIKESGAYRQSTFDSVLGLWKIGITENVAKDMKEVTAQIAKTLKEFDSVGKDFELEDILSANMKSLRTKLRAESTWCKNHFDSLRKSVKDFRFDSLNCSSWSKSLSLLSSAIEIDEVVLKFVEYLSLEPLSNNFVYSFSIKPTQTSWKEWKSDSRYTAASINSATHRPPNRKKSVSSRFPQLEALKLNVSTTDINRIKNDVTKSTSTPSFSQPSKDDILLPPLPTKLSQTPSLINLEGLESEPIHDLSKLFRAWTTAAREKLVQAYEKAGPEILKEASVTSVVIKKGEVLPPPPAPFLVKTNKELDCFSKDANEFRESQIKCLNEVVFESRSTLENATNLIFKSLADYSLGKIDDAWNTITDKFMKEWSAVEDIKLSTMNSLKDILSLGNPLQNLNDLDLKVNRALLQLEPLVIKTESACTESFSTILIDFSQRMQFISILVADIQYNLKTIDERQISFPPSQLVLTSPVFDILKDSTPQGANDHSLDCTLTFSDDVNSSPYQCIISARNNAINQARDKLGSLKQCLSAQAKEDLDARNYWLKRWNTQLEMVKQSL